MLIGAFVVGSLLGGLAVWFVLRERVRAQRLTAVELSDTFKALSAETLHQTTSSFLDLAKDKIEGVANTHLQPIKESLQRFDEKVERLEQARQKERGALSEQLLALKEGADKLRGETASLVGALRASEVRGQWGQLQLENTLELAGMLEHCDFQQEVSSSGDDGVLRPTWSSAFPAESTSSWTRRCPGWTRCSPRSRPRTTPSGHRASTNSSDSFVTGSAASARRRTGVSSCLHRIS